MALLQETPRPPAGVAQCWRSQVWSGKPGSLWGCAVVARSLQLERVQPADAYPWLAERTGTTAIARAATDPRWLVSVHFPHERMSRQATKRSISASFSAAFSVRK